MKISGIVNKDKLDWSEEGGQLSMRVAGKTDFFLDPAEQYTADSAPILFQEIPNVDFSCEVTIRSELASTFDAAGFFLRCGTDWYLKFEAERAPTGELLIVSVLTTGFSDDCNGPEVSGPVTLRANRIGNTVSMHLKLEDSSWRLIRYCRLPSPGALELGFTVQSPLGGGVYATFSDGHISENVPQDIRSGT